MSWFASLTWSQAALLLCGLTVVAWAIYLAVATVERLPDPHHSARRNGTEAVP